MERMFKKLFSIAALLSMVAAQANNVTPTLVLRSQGFHGDRQKWVGMTNHINLDEMESWYGTFDVAVGYMRSFRDDRLGFCLFGKDLNCESCPNEVLIQGSLVSNRNANAWLAEYLYLPCNYTGSFSIDPRIQNVVVDLDLYLGLDEWVNGMFFRVYGPVTWSKWETNFCDGDGGGIDNSATATCSAGYFTPGADTAGLTRPADYFNGTAPTMGEGVTGQALKWAKMPNCDNSEVGFADLRMILGWNFLQDEDYYVGAYIQAAAPTGSKRRASFVMDPVVGNGSHWELGGGLQGSYVFWNSEDSEKQFGFYFDVSLSHLFKASEQRTFDLKGKDNSRYMLAAKFRKLAGSDVPHLVVADSNSVAAGTAAGAAGTLVNPGYIFDSVYAPVANLTTMEVDVSIGVQADVVAMFNFTSRGFSWDLGYNFWGRTCETFACVTDCSPCNPDSLCPTDKTVRWGLKGDARMFGFDVTTNPAADPVGQAVPLSATDSNATIHNGSNAAQSAADARRNFGVDTARFAYGSATLTTNNILSSTPSRDGGTATAAFHIKSTKTPVLLRCEDVEFTETRGLSHKLFTHVSYTWERDNWTPYLGLGGSVEFGRADSCGDCSTDCNTSCEDPCDSCVTCALSQWSVWVKGGLAFN